MLNNKHPKVSPSGEVGGAREAGGALYRSLYALLLPGLPQSLSECRSRGLRLFDRMLDEVRSGSVSPVSRLRLLSSSFDLLNGVTLVSDLERSDRWYQLAESVVDRCPAPTGCSGLLQTSLCRCLTDCICSPWQIRGSPPFFLPSGGAVPLRKRPWSVWRC